MMLTIILLLLAVTVSGCIGQSVPVHNLLYNFTKDGVEYEFSTNVYDAIKISIYGKEDIYSRLVLTDRVLIIYGNNSADAPYIATASAELASKLVHYYAYSQGRLVSISGMDLDSYAQNETARNMSATLVEYRGPNTGANGTYVRLEGDRIVVEALNGTEMKSVSDRLMLVLFEDDLRAMGIGLP